MNTPNHEERDYKGRFLAKEPMPLREMIRVMYEVASRKKIERPKLNFFEREITKWHQAHTNQAIAAALNEIEKENIKPRFGDAAGRGYLQVWNKINELRSRYPVEKGEDAN